MRIIDLLNKIANGEIDKNNKYKFSRDDYCTVNEFFARYIVDEENLNLEIIEEVKKIEKVPIGKYKPTHRIKKIEKKLNEIIDKINRMEDK